MRILFASHNENKVLEIRKLIPQGLELLSLADIGYHDEIEENGQTLEENSLLKARTIFEKTGVATIADDTGLEVEALNGAPGVFSARYAGHPRSDQANMDKLLSELSPQTNRTARFRTIFTLILQGEVFQFEGKVEGQIGIVKKGEKGFGYDPIFYPENALNTFAEMTLEEKNAFSHRARALNKLLSFLNAKFQRFD